MSRSVVISAVGIGTALAMGCSGPFRYDPNVEGNQPPSMPKEAPPLPSTSSLDAGGSLPFDSGVATAVPGSDGSTSELRTVTVRFHDVYVGEDGSFGAAGLYEWAEWHLWVRCADKSDWVLQEWIKSPTGRLQRSVTLTFQAKGGSFQCDAGGLYWTQANSNPSGYPIPPGVTTQSGAQLKVSGMNSANGVNYEIDADIEVR